MGLKKSSNKVRKQRGKVKEQVTFPLPEAKLHLPKGYNDFITQISNEN